MTHWPSHTFTAPPVARPGLRVAGRKILDALRCRLLSVRHPGLTWDGAAEIGRRCRFTLSGGGRVQVGDGAAFAEGTHIYARGGSLHIGARSYVGHGAILAAQDSITIGNDVLIAEYVTIRDQDHVPPGPDAGGFLTAPIEIGDHVWLGAKVTVTRGVKIGARSVIAAGAVVTHDIPPGAMAAGVPARILCYREGGQ